MVSMLRLACVGVLFAASNAGAQASPAPAAPAALDSATMNVVTEYSVKGGKIVLASAASPIPTYMPDGTYTNESNTIIVILEGAVVRVQSEAGAITEVESVRMNRQRIITLTPSTNALMQVSDIKLPSGTFTSEDGRSSITIVQGRPTAFTIGRH
jgi:hypothetical protein